MNTEQQNVDLVDAEVVGRFARAALLAALMAAGAWVSIPMPLGPSITLQMLVVFLAGLFLGPAWGAFSIVLYLFAGAIGVPVFAERTSGLGVLLAETGGFLLSFPVGALVVGLVVHRGRSLRNPAGVSTPVIVAGLVAATAIVYGVGFVWYAELTQISLGASFTALVVPYIPGEIVKIVAATAIAKLGRIDPR
ncbi:biotin transporter BioY [Natrialbaceae archaeon GCM10025810]|uniref:biotin transporter BioY n=1 Tax=Halovalidus salilacus TaxID=3075124 RepID=UPI003612FC38